MSGALGSHVLPAAGFAYYPVGVYGAVADEGLYTGAPILMLLGEKDDNLPGAKIEDYLSYGKAVGREAPIEVVVCPGASHAWTVSTVGPVSEYRSYCGPALSLPAGATYPLGFQFLEPSREAICAVIFLASATMPGAPQHMILRLSHFASRRRC
jgi:dienelactone hydrolase